MSAELTNVQLVSSTRCLESEGHTDSCLKEIQPLLARKSRNTDFWYGITSDIQIESKGALSERDAASVIKAEFGSKVRDRIASGCNQSNAGGGIRFHKGNRWLNAQIGVVDERVRAAIEKICGVGERMFSAEEAAMSKTRSEHSKSMRVKSLNQIGCTTRG